MTAFWTAIAALGGAGLGGFALGTVVTERYWTRNLNQVQAALREWGAQLGEPKEEPPSVAASREW